MSILFIGHLCIGTYCRKYKIIGASFQRAIIEDDTLFKDKLVYLLDFDYKFCDKKLTFLSPALEPGVFGCTDIVKLISVTDSNNNEIKFTHEGQKIYDINVQSDDKDRFITYPMISGKNFSDLVKDINQNIDDGKRFNISTTRYYLINEGKTLPKYMKIYLDDKVIDCSVNNNPIMIRNVVNK